jgi:4-hydroxy-3-methylbut-2-enyl diphosphate reductase
VLGDYIAAPTSAKRAALLEKFGAVATPGFDPDRHLERIAVVNQTTLLMNETSAIIDYFEQVFTARHGAIEAAVRIGGAGRKDTLCYATQVNQDALGRALDQPLDAAFVIGGKNSSNTYQLHRLCEQKLGPRAYFIQSEANIRSRIEVDHFVFSAHRTPADGRMESRPLWKDDTLKTVLLTGGASCPDGLVQQVIVRINSLFPSGKLRPVETVLAELQR